MARVLLVHWNEDEAKERSVRLSKAGVEVAGIAWTGGGVTKALKRCAPVGAIVISLERLPSYGRIIGEFLRQTKSARSLPLIYIECPDPGKVEKVKASLPDAQFTNWKGIAAAVKKAKPVESPLVPGWSIASGKLVRDKLGIKENMRIGRHGAPDEFEELLGDLPEGVTFIDRGKADLWFWFVRSAEELINEIDFMSLRSPLWICWAKGLGELKQPLIRETAKAASMVDYKICSINKTWSGMLFRIKEKRTR